ncbi:MAG TPA: DUF4914 family protein, partial [Tenuifilaceae bacterium]|nr:DUF4914 family protein [Tenuifilaceae bacterium]
MSDFFEILKKKGVPIPVDVELLLTQCKGYTVYNTTNDLAIAALGGEQNETFKVEYDVPCKGIVTEAIVHRVTNGVSANYIEPYMRRRDPGTMVIADDLPSDKTRFTDKYGYKFESLKSETFTWLKNH